MAEISDAFRAHFAEHNRRVILLAILSAVLTAAGWAAFYFVLHAFVLLWLTIAHGIEAQQPPFLFSVFGASAVIFTLVVALTRRLSPHERLADRKPPWEILLDFVLALPRATLSIWDTLSAYQFLNERELELAWQLANRIGREKRFPVQAVAQEIPAERDRYRIVTALQFVDLIELRKRDDEFYLALNGDEARRLCEPRLHFRLPQ